MDTGKEFRIQMERLFSQVAGREPAELRDAYVATFRDGQLTLEGSTIPAIVPLWKQRASGIIVPQNLTTPHPLDLCLAYLTAEEVFGFCPPPGYVISQLQRIPVADVLLFVSQVLNEVRMPGASRREVDRRYVEQWFNGDTKARALNLLRNPERGLIVPQALFLLAKLSLVYSGDVLLPGVRPGNIVAALITLTQYLGQCPEDGKGTVIGDAPGPLGRELIANQYFNSSNDSAKLMARFTRCWYQIPAEREGEPGICDLAGAYQTATGVSLADLTVVGSVLWAAAFNGGPHVAPSYLATLGWEESHLEGVLKLIVCDIPGFREVIGAEREEERSEWSFDAFGRWPVIRLHDDSLLVLDQELLVKRIFGWLPFFDIKFPPPDSKPPGHRKLVATADQCLRHVEEIYVTEILHSIADGGAARRVYDDPQLQAAFRQKGRRIADVAIDYGDAWVVVEITTTTLKRESVKAISEQAQIEDLDKLVGEVEQIDATIQSLREGEARLTDTPTAIKKVYFPLLVMAEGFPVNPVTLTVLRERVKAQGLLEGDDVRPLEVVDVEDLEIIEGLQEEGGPSLRSILDMKRTAGLSKSAVRDYIIVELGQTPQRSRRVHALWDHTVRPVVEAVAHLAGG
ncbi:hypothetical protein R6V09_11675 [Streptomyces sp. W16]|uniref:hypothetical protein n=1 Tax=Streptomyces sp. W16 TaxID=3076631 RepID=UPI00295BD5E0|nr:hypothetical protein [Streptomyces sp. W16]MDV9170787.1 hypothetical protein [Streptomyces sp. W16]